MTPTAQLNAARAVLDTVYEEAAALINYGKIPEHWGRSQIVWLCAHLLYKLTVSKQRKAKWEFTRTMTKIEKESHA